MQRNVYVTELRKAGRTLSLGSLLPNPSTHKCNAGAKKLIDPPLKRKLSLPQFAYSPSHVLRGIHITPDTGCVTESNGESKDVVRHNDAPLHVRPLMFETSSGML